MENMLKMLLTGDFRRWGVIQDAQYTRWFGCVQHIGIEIESHKQLIVDGFSKTACRTGTELTYLFDVTNAQKFYHRTKWVVQQLGKHNFPTLGALHINVQFGNDFSKSLVAPEDEESQKFKYTSRRASNMHRDILNSSHKKGLGRVEFKQCSPFIEPIDLFTQMLFCAAIVHRANETDLDRLVTAIQEIRKQSLSPTIIDLTSFLYSNRLLKGEYSRTRR